MQCVANTLFFLWSEFSVELSVLSVYRSTSMLTVKLLHEYFVPPPEVASLSQQGRIAAAQHACDVFSIEQAPGLPKYISIASVLVKL